MKFVCKEDTCTSKENIVDVHKVVMKFIGGKLVEQVYCPTCGSLMQVYDDGSKPSLSSIHIGKYSSASKQDKREILKKRSREHFKKHIKPFKDHQMERAMGELKSIGK